MTRLAATVAAALTAAVALTGCQTDWHRGIPVNVTATATCK